MYNKIPSNNEKTIQLEKPNHILTQSSTPENIERSLRETHPQQRNSFQDLLEIENFDTFSQSDSDCSINLNHKEQTRFEISEHDLLFKKPQPSQLENQFEARWLFPETPKVISTKRPIWDPFTQRLVNPNEPVSSVRERSLDLASSESEFESPAKQFDFNLDFAPNQLGTSPNAKTNASKITHNFVLCIQIFGNTENEIPDLNQKFKQIANSAAEIFELRGQERAIVSQPKCDCPGEFLANLANDESNDLFGRHFLHVDPVEFASVDDLDLCNWQEPREYDHWNRNFPIRELANLTCIHQISEETLVGGLTRQLDQVRRELVDKMRSQVQFESDFMRMFKMQVDMCQADFDRLGCKFQLRFLCYFWFRFVEKLLVRRFFEDFLPEVQMNSGSKSIPGQWGLFLG